LLIETAKPYWTYSQRLRQASDDITRQMIIDHEVIPAAGEESDQRTKNLLLRLVATSRAA
jgi:hypothetical protein